MSEENDKTRDLIPEILISIRGKIEETNREVRELRNDTNARFRELRADTNARFGQVNERLLNIENDVRSIRSHIDLDHMTLATELGEVRGKLETHLQQPHRT